MLSRSAFPIWRASRIASRLSATSQGKLPFRGANVGAKPVEQAGALRARVRRPVDSATASCQQCSISGHLVALPAARASRARRSEALVVVLLQQCHRRLTMATPSSCRPASPYRRAQEEREGDSAWRVFAGREVALDRALPQAHASLSSPLIESARDNFSHNEAYRGFDCRRSAYRWLRDMPLRHRGTRCAQLRWSPAFSYAAAARSRFPAAAQWCASWTTSPLIASAQTLRNFPVDRLPFGRKQLAIDDLSRDRVPECEMAGAIAAFIDELPRACGCEARRRVRSAAIGHARQQLCLERPSDDRRAKQNAPARRERAARSAREPRRGCSGERVDVQAAPSATSACSPTLRRNMAYPRPMRRRARLAAGSAGTSAGHKLATSVSHLVVGERLDVDLATPSRSSRSSASRRT